MASAVLQYLDVILVMQPTSLRMARSRQIFLLFTLPRIGEAASSNVFLGLRFRNALYAPDKCKQRPYEHV